MRYLSVISAFTTLSLAGILLSACSPDPRVRVSIDTPTGMRSGDVTITFRIRHRSSLKVDLKVAYSDDGGQTFHPATVVDPATLTVLDSSPDGVDHSLEWDTIADGVGTVCATAGARFQLRPFTKADHGEHATTGDFEVNNGTVSAPSVAVTTPAGTQSGAFDIDFVLTDPESDDASVQVEFSSDGGATFAPATIAPYGDSLTDLSTSPVGEQHTFTWDSPADVGFGVFNQARVRITADDGTTSTACIRSGETIDFDVDNTGIMPRLYVTRPGSPAISEMDATTEIVGSILTPAASPMGLAAVRQARGNFLMVTDPPSDQVIVIDLSDNGIEAQMPVESAPMGIVVARIDLGAGTVLQCAYVANSGSDSISVLDADTFNPVFTTSLPSVGSTPTGMAAATISGTSFVYATLAGDHGVAVIDATLNVFDSAILFDPRTNTTPGPIAAVEGSTGAFLYVGNTGSSTVTVIDAANKTVIGSALSGVSFPSPSGISALTVPGGRTLALIACAGDGSVRVIDVDAGHLPFATIDRAATDPRGITTLRTLSGSRAYVVDASAGALGKIDLDLIDAGGPALPLPPAPGLPPGILEITSTR